MSRKYLQELMKNLQEFYRCPSCNTNYNFSDIKLLGQIDQYCFVQLSCHECSLPVLATVSVSGTTIHRHDSDLRKNEESKFASKGAITPGEIADFHRFLSEWDGDLSRLS